MGVAQIALLQVVNAICGAIQHATINRTEEVEQMLHVTIHT